MPILRTRRSASNGQQPLIEKPRNDYSTFLRSLVFYVYLTVGLVLCGLFYGNYRFFKYDYYVFAQQWPAALCKEINATHHGTCHAVPSNVDTWVVHGLWPSRFNAHHHYGPFNCNDSWPFQLDGLKPMMVEMRKYWPNLMENTETGSFWEHEWSKHGTCACQEGCSSEVDYFQKAINLRDIQNFDGKLAERNITPSHSKTYDMKEIIETLTPSPSSGRYQCYLPDVLGDGTPNVDSDPDTRIQVLAQIMLCLDKYTYAKIDCKAIEDGEEMRGRSIYDGSFDSGPYSPGPCEEDRKVMIYPTHMPMRP